MAVDNASLVDPTAAQVRVLNRWRVSTFWVMLIGYVGYYMGRANLAVALDLLHHEFGFTNTDLGLIGTFGEIAYAAGKFTAGPLADKIGGRKFFLTGLIGGMVFNIVFPSCRTLLAFTAVACLIRYFLSMGWGGLIKTIGEWYEAERNGTIMGLISINFQIGPSLATVFCGYLLYLGVGWQGLFYYPALIMAIVAIWAYFCSREGPHEVYPNVRFGRYNSKRNSLAALKESHGKRSVRDIVKRLLKIRMFRQILLFSVLSHILRAFYLFWTVKFLIDIGMSQVAAAMTSSIFPILGCLGTIFLGWYTDRYAKDGDRARMMWIMLIGLMISLMMVAMLVPFQLLYQNWLVAFLGIAGFCLFGPYSMSAGCLSLDIAGSEAAGTCTGMIDGFGYIGAALATWGAGILSDRLGWSQVFWILSGFALLAVFSCYNMSRAFRADLRLR